MTGTPITKGTANGTIPDTKAPTTIITTSKFGINNIGRLNLSFSVSSFFCVIVCVTSLCKISSFLAIRFFSCLPKCIATIVTQINPTPKTGISGLNNSVIGNSKDVAALIVGPPQGTMFITPAVNPTIRTNVRGLIFNDKYIGNNADTAIKYVLDPEPSKCATAAITTVPIAILIGSPFDIRITYFIIGSNKPASYKIPKNKIANVSMIPVWAIELSPELIYSPSSTRSKPAINAITIGATVKPKCMDTFFVKTSDNITAIIKNPQNDNISTSPFYN